MTDKFDEMAAIAGRAGGLEEKQWPGLAIIFRSLAAETIEECAKVADEYRVGNDETKKGIAKSIRALSKTQEVGK